MKKLAIITSHPIQYNAPLYKKIAERGNIDINVFYTWSQAENGFFDAEFNKIIKWNIPLLEDYNYEFVENISKKPNSKHYKGIICPNLIAKIKQWNPDAILVFGWAFHAHLKVLKYFNGKVPVIFRGDSTLLDEKTGLRKIFRTFFLKYVYNFVDYAFFVGTHNKEYFIRAGLKDNQLIYLPYTINKEHFEDNEINQYNKKARNIREQLGIKQTDKVIAFIGKFIKKKNPIFLLKAIQKYNTQNKTSVKLLFIGSGKQEEKLKEFSSNDKNIFFLPFTNQKEMPVAYRIADIFVLPSKGPRETWGVSVNEALACERFVLISNKVGSAVDLVKDNVNGQIFESDNIQDFTKKLDILLQKTKFDQTKKTNNYTLTKAVLTIENIFKQL